nr:type II CRISPR RNA-guided endonuclease Cas9 [uncultured Senegalimassilia sp.]
MNDLPGSPAVRRSLNQAIRIVDEIAHIAGKPPKHVFIEVTRDEDAKNKGRRTKRRYDQLKEALTEFKKQDPDIWRELQSVGPEDLDERLTLYFMQRGKCLYSGKAIDINQLSNAGVYEVDHIIPRSYIKDDSFENKALVLRECNQRKTDAMLLDPAIRQKMSGYWKSLHDAKLIGDKKFNNLMRSHVNENAMRGFIARQLVETSQMVKFAQSLLSVKYPDTKVVPVKASMSHNLREAAGFVKCREANDFHHAHDAFLACRIGLFISKWYPDMYERPIAYAHAMRKYVREQAQAFNARHEAPGSAGFVVGSFMSSRVDDETGELWNGPEEVEGIRRALNYRQCYISRMPVEDSGQFWDATIYSPRDPKMGPKLSLRLKEDLDTAIYGGYSRVQFAYFFIYEARDKKGRTVFRFSQVPVWLAPRIRRDEGALAEYAKQLAEEEKLEFVGIQRTKVLKKQLVEIDGERFFITGKREMRNATEIAFSQEDTALLERFVQKKNGRPFVQIQTTSQSDDIFTQILSAKGRSSRLLSLVKIDDIRYRLSDISESERLEYLMRIIALLNGSANMVDLLLVGGSKYSGAMNPSFSKLLTDPSTDFFIIDQSVTGMFERRTRVGL